jgi:triosephosphate isomerase (TIM)
MTKPIILINFKNYVSGKAALDLARTIEIYCNHAWIAVPALDIELIAKQINMPVLAQHADISSDGKSTGFVLAENLASIGAFGTILNHSEHKLKSTVLKKTIAKCNSAGLKTIVCASTLKEAALIKKLNPYAIAFEESKLIGTGKSITREDSSAVSSFAKLLEGTDIIPLCGAGISSGEDVAKAIILGCKGVLVSSAIAHPTSPGGAEKFLKELSELF